MTLLQLSSKYGSARFVICIPICFTSVLILVSPSLQVLQKVEAEKWRGTTIPYNPLAVHTTVPLVLYEHQRLDMRFKTLAVSGGKPKFSASGLGRRGRRAPFELRLPRSDETTGKKELPAWRSDVQLPFREDPFRLPAPGAHDNREGAERSHFWL